MEGLSHFEEKAGAVASNHEWGRWHQTVQEVNVEVSLSPGTTARQLAVRILPNELQCGRADGSKGFLKGKLFGTVKVDESIWTIEEKRTLRIVLAKANYSTKEAVWTSLFREGNEGIYPADKETEQKMRTKLDLERFQLEYPGMDFSSAKLQKQ